MLLTHRMYVGILLFALASLLASARDTVSRETIADLHCDAITLTHIDADAAEIEINVGGTAQKSFTAESIYFDHVSVNGIPLRLSPVRGPLQFHKGRDLDGFPSVSANASFREIPSLEPVQRMIRDKSAHVHLDLLARLDLNPLQMLALRSSTIWVSATLDQDAALEVPGGAIGQLAAGAALVAAEPVWELANGGRDWRTHLTEFGDQAQRALDKSLVEIRTSFEVSSRSEGAQIIETHNVGFILPGGRILTVDEAVEPWIYSSALAQAVSRHEASVDTRSVEILVHLLTPVEQSPADFSLRKGELRVLTQKSKTDHIVSDSGKGVYRMALRNQAENCVLLKLQGFHAPANILPLAAVADFDDWTKAAVFRFDAGSRLVAWVTDAKQSHGRITLRDASPEATGSPIWLESGIAGILQDDSSGATADTVSKRFRPI